jgi:diacylglycerol O-acyltransferase
VSVPVDGQTLNITCTSVNGQMSFCLTACRHVVPAIGTLADLLGRELDLLNAFHRLPGQSRRDRHRSGPRQASRRAGRTALGDVVRLSRETGPAPKPPEL